MLSLRRGELVRWKFEIGQLDFELSAVFAAAGANGEQTQEQLLEARPARILLFVRPGLCGAHAYRRRSIPGARYRCGESD